MRPCSSVPRPRFIHPLKSLNVIHGTRKVIVPRAAWWTVPAPSNVSSVSGVQELVDVLDDYKEQLVIVDVYAEWCASCRALYPKILKLADENPEVLFVTLNFDSNKDLCQRLKVKAMPWFMFFRGSEGQVANFSASISKVGLIKDAIQTHSAPRCSLEAPGPILLSEYPNIVPHTFNTNKKKSNPAITTQLMGEKSEALAGLKLDSALFVI